jgi:hypothetical protein
MSALADVVRGGPVDVVTGDYLAEVTMLVLAKTRMKDPEAGYARSFLAQIEPVLSEIAERGIKVVVNAGGLNPAGLATATRDLCRKAGVSLAVAHIEGDDIAERLPTLKTQGIPLQHLDTGRPLSDWDKTPLTANAYLGGWGVSAALERGADIVICPRVADASLVVGAAAWWHGWNRDDWDALAGAVIAGHVIECGTQATGGNYSGFTNLPELHAPGFPLADIDEDGTSRITKHEGTGGSVTVGTVSAQLMYEIQGLDYLNSDVSSRLDSIELVQLDHDVVEIRGVQGAPPPTTTKVSITALGGYQNSTMFVLTGLNIREKAELVQRELEARLTPESGVDELRFELIGDVSDDADSQLEASCILRVAARGEERAVGRSFFNVLVEQALASYPGLYMGGGGARAASTYGAYWPAVIPQSLLDHRIVLDNGETLRVDLPPMEDVAPRTSRVLPPSRDWGPTLTVPLGSLFDARSGDKGGNANVGIWTDNDQAFAWAEEVLTAEMLRTLVPEAAALEVERYVLPKLRAMNFVIKGLLDGGATETLRFDGQAKALGEYVRARHVPLPRTMVPS